ncbi:MFS transporter [bacterium]|nr:MFS transporter [bacterium]MBU4509463.1 MFS transporter [bacterium]
MKKHLLQQFSSIFSIYSGFPRTIYILFVCRLINAMGYFVFPFLTLFLTRNLSLSADKVGLYLMCVEICRIIGALFGGRFTDIFGRKRTLISFQFAIAVFLFPCAFLGDSLIIPKLLAIAAFFNGATRPVYDAIMVDMSTPKNRKEIFSFIYLGLNLGFGIGSLIAGFLYTRYIKFLFLGNVVIILFVCLFIYINIVETLPYKVQLKNDNDKLVQKQSLLKILLQKPIVLYFSLVSILFYLAHSQFFFSLPLQINDLFGQIGPRYFGMLMSFNCFIVVFMTMPVTLVSRQNRPILNVTFSGIFFAIGFGMLYWIYQFNWILVSTFIWTIGEILIRTNAGVYIANHSPATHRGRFNSLVTISESISRIIGPPMLGLVITNLGIRQVWVFIFFISIIATVLMYLIYFAERGSK